MDYYKLCKALKDAGFPQKYSLSQHYIAPNGVMFWAKTDPKEWHSSDKAFEEYGPMSEWARYPSSDELKKRCQEMLDKQLAIGISG